MQYPAFFLQLVGTVLTVDGRQVVDPHCVIHGFGDVRRSDSVIGRVGSMFVARSVGLSTLDASTGQQIGQTVRPVVAASSGDSTGTRVADFRFAAHFAGDKDQR